MDIVYRTGDGDVKIPEQKPEFYVYFFYIDTNITKSLIHKSTPTLFIKHLIMNTFQTAFMSKTVKIKHLMILTMKQIKYPTNHYMPFYLTLFLKYLIMNVSSCK